MRLPPRLHKFALTAHITASVGWLGAIIGVLAIAIVGSTSDDPQTVRGAYLVMEQAAVFVLVPLAFASLLTGLVQSLGSSWGLFRHYWVLFKLVINVVATLVLLLYLQTLDHLADIASDPRSGLASIRSFSPVLHASAAVLLLVVATTLAVYKPRGVTPYGRRKEKARAEARTREFF